MITLNKQQLAMALNKGYYTTSLTEKDRRDIYFWFNRQQPGTAYFKSLICNKIEKMKPPIVVLHSGGVDSTFMLLMAMKCFKTKDITAVSIASSESAYDESNVSREICNHLGITHNQPFIHDDSLDDTLDAITEDTYKELFFSSSIVPTYEAMRWGAEISPSILTGDGGDELFCGYDRYLVYKYLRHVPKQLLGMASGLGDSRRNRKLKSFAYNGYEAMVEIFPFKEVQKMTRVHIPATLTIGDNTGYGTFGYTQFDDIPNVLNMTFDSIKLPSLDKCMYFDIMTELFGLETKKVQTAQRMAGNPNVTSPFLDMEVIEYCCRLPIKYKYKRFTRKYLLRKIIQKDIPWYNTLSKKKKGFAFPLLEHIKDRQISPGILDHDYIRLRNVVYGWEFKPEVLVDKNSEKLWALFMLDHLMKKGIVQVEL